MAIESQIHHQITGFNGSTAKISVNRLILPANGGKLPANNPARIFDIKMYPFSGEVSASYRQ